MRQRNNGRWYSIEMKAGADEADVFIYDEISWYGMTARDFVAELQGIEAATLNVRINSPGGNVFDGIAIYNALRRHSAKVITHVDGVAASIASVIALAGQEVRIASTAFFMIHDPFVMVVGTAAELRKMADTVEKVGEDLVGIYADQSNQSKRQVRQWMSDETWFNAEEAKAAGFATSITEGPEVQAAFDLSAFRNAPQGLKAELDHARTTPDQRIESIRDFEAFLRDEGGFSHAAAKRIAAGGYKPKSEPRDEDDEPATWIAGVRALTAAMNPR